MARIALTAADSGKRPADQGGPSTAHDVLRAPGRPLEEKVRREMEARLGWDFSQVRVHTDAAARRSTAEVGAHAYTSGNHVVMGGGGANRRTLAHELTHVMQQWRGPVSGTDDGRGLRVSDPADRFEREAEATAARALSGPVPAVPGTDSVGDAHVATAPAATAAATVQRWPQPKPVTDPGTHTHVDPDYPGLRLTLDTQLSNQYRQPIYRIEGSQKTVYFNNEIKGDYFTADDGLAAYDGYETGASGLAAAQADLTGHFTPRSTTSYHYKADESKIRTEKVDAFEDFRSYGIGRGELVEVSVTLLQQRKVSRELQDDDPETRLRIDDVKTGIGNSIALEPLKITLGHESINLGDGNHRLQAAVERNDAYVPCIMG